jgi:hypothetical protein
MQPDDIHTIQDFISYCHDILAEQPEYMREKEQEKLATALVCACLVDSFNELEKSYPVLTEIFDIASDLEWSNSFNTTIDWRRIKELVDKLEKQAKFA